jgi:hypothetical protein
MTIPAGRVAVNCAQPIEPAVLMDYWLAALPPETEATVEEHLMGCDRCGDRLREIIALAEGLRTLSRSGSLQVVLTDQFVKHAGGAGQRVRQYAPPAGGSVQCTVAADDDLLVGRLAADLSGAARVDLSWCNEQGVEFLRMADIPVQADTGMVVCQQSITIAKASSSNTLIARLVAVDPEGAERLLGEYAFHHTRTIPGPGIAFPPS